MIVQDFTARQLTAAWLCNTYPCMIATWSFLLVLLQLFPNYKFSIQCKVPENAPEAVSVSLISHCMLIQVKDLVARQHHLQLPIYHSSNTHLSRPVVMVTVIITNWNRLYPNFIISYMNLIHDLQAVRMPGLLICFLMHLWMPIA